MISLTCFDWKVSHFSCFSGSPSGSTPLEASFFFIFDRRPPIAPATLFYPGPWFPNPLTDLLLLFTSIYLISNLRPSVCSISMRSSTAMSLWSFSFVSGLGCLFYINIKNYSSEDLSRINPIVTSFRYSPIRFLKI